MEQKNFHSFIDTKLSSLEVADIIGKSHNKVLSDINRFIARGADPSYFEPIVFTGPQGEKRVGYLLNVLGIMYFGHECDLKTRALLVHCWSLMDETQKLQEVPSISEAMSQATEKQEKSQHQQQHDILINLVGII